VKRWPLVAALLYAAAVVAGLFIAPATPSVAASGHALISYYRDHADSVRLVAWLGAVSTIPLALLAAAVRRLLTGVGRDVFLIGVVGIIGSTTIWLWIGAGLALHPASVDPSTARVIANIAAYFAPLLTIPVLLVVTPVACAARQHGTGVPTWLGILSAVVAIEQITETLTILDTRGFTAPGGSMNLHLGAPLFLIWVIATGAATTAGSRSRPTTVPQPDTRTISPSAAEPQPQSG
jgi:hypothetical protein